MICIVGGTVKVRSVGGKTAIKTVENVVFSTRALADGKSLDLLMDIQMPELPGKKPLVVYVTGGGFGGLPTASKFLTSVTDVQAVVDKFGTSDMSKLAADFDPMRRRRTMQTTTPSLNTSEWRREPMYWILISPAPLQTR